MTTYAELQTRVQHIVIDLPTSVTNAVPRLLNAAMRTMQQRHNFAVMRASEDYTTVAATRSLGSLPARWKAPRGRPYYLDVYGRPRYVAFAASRDDAIRAFGSTEGGEADADLLTGPPQALALSLPSDELGTRTLEVYPLSDGLSLYANGEYRLIVPYWRYVTPLAAPVDTNWFTENADEWLEFTAAASAFFLDWDEERGTLWTQRAAEKYADVVRADKREQIGQLTEVPVSANTVDPKVWPE